MIWLKPSINNCDLKSSTWKKFFSFLFWSLFRITWTFLRKTLKNSFRVLIFSKKELKNALILKILNRTLSNLQKVCGIRTVSKSVNWLKTFLQKFFIFTTVKDFSKIFSQKSLNLKLVINLLGLRNCRRKKEVKKLLKSKRNFQNILSKKGLIYKILGNQSIKN